MPTFDEFVNVLAEHLTPFCLPRNEINDAFKDISPTDHVALGSASDRLNNKARSLFIRAKKGSNRSGEAGEIALYILNEWVLEAPQIVSKMYLKTNNNMPVHGTDGIHAKYDSESQKLLLYWGESKCYQSFSGALDAALTSIKDFIDEGHEQREIDIITDHYDLGELDDASKNAILEFLDPYSENSNERIAIFSCLLLFEDPYALDGDINGDEIEAAFAKELANVADKFVSSIAETLKKRGLEKARFEFFLLPVPSSQDFRDKFQARIGWPP